MGEIGERKFNNGRRKTHRVGIGEVVFRSLRGQIILSITFNFFEKEHLIT